LLSFPKGICFWKFEKAYNWQAHKKRIMRIVTWNCCGKFASKANELLALNPDIAIVPESLLADANSLEQQGYRSIWFGDAGQKGLAI
jgi:hypothetical protein